MGHLQTFKSAEETAQGGGKKTNHLDLDAHRSTFMWSQSEIFFKLLNETHLDFISVDSLLLSKENTARNQMKTFGSSLHYVDRGTGTQTMC